MAPQRLSLRQSSRKSLNNESSTNEPNATNALNTFSGVVIPSHPSTVSSGFTSPNISTRSTTADYDTPNTSNFATPAASVSDKPTRSSQAHSTRLLTAMGRSPSALQPATKRKRGSGASTVVRAADNTTRDEELARQLQEDEYNIKEEEIESPPPKKRGRPAKSLSLQPQSTASARLTKTFKKEIKDSEDEGDLLESELSELGEVEDTESEFENTTNLDSDEEMEVDDTQAASAPTAVVPAATPQGASNASGVVVRRVRRADADIQAGADDDDDDDEEADVFQTARRSRFQKWHNDRKTNRRRRLETAHPEIKTMWDDLKKVPIIKPVQAAQPDSITRSLKSFQLEGLDWMVKQEKTHYKGGLLGDEMGMGKTIQAVSLIMSDFPAKAPSLVLVPPVALMQWQNEINAYTNNTLKVLVVHGSNSKSKNLTVKMIKSYNVVLMSYNSLESMYRKQEKGWSRGEDLVKEDSPIHSVTFHRIILDEAHSIKSRNTGAAKACFALKGTYKWTLSGTPVQNRIGEFFSLLRFLGVRPFADYFCDKCPCAELHWTIDENYKCRKCNHSASEHRSIFNEEILNPMIGEGGNKDEALDKLHLITDRIMLRRMKKDYTSSMELPPKLVQVRNEFFSNVERDFATSIMSNTARTFDTYVSRGVMLNNYANIFGLLMMMRQVANHPDLILKKNAEGGQNVLVCNMCDEVAEDAVRSKCKHEFCRTCVKSLVESEEPGSPVDCPRCHIPLEIDLEQPEIIQDEEQVKKSSIINRIRMSEWTSSTKIELLVYELYKLRSSKRTVKSIVFSQFTSMLQLVEWRLRRAGFTTVMLDGSMTPVQRQRSIDHFMNNVNVEVFLVSLKAGGVALNLTEASRVFIIDPWWNPAAEWQSADRCHRIGQARPCVITRLVIEDSVESRMVQLQEKKSNLIASTVNKDKSAMDKLTEADLQFLFRGT